MARRRLLRLAIALALASACAGFGPPLRAVERLCQGDAECWSQVRQAETLEYYSVRQALQYGLAHLHERPEVRYPRYSDMGVTVFPGPEPGTYRIELVEVGISNHVMVQLADDAIAWGHAHPHPFERDCSPLESRMVVAFGIDVFVQHADGPLVECRGRGISPPPGLGARPTGARSPWGTAPRSGQP